MDALSRLLTLYPLHTALDVRCQFGAPWRIEHAAAAPGVAPYHMIARGGAKLDAGDVRGRELEAGDIVVLPHGSAHRLYTGRRPAPSHDVPGEHVVTVKTNDGSGPASDILCGEFRFEADAAHGLLAALPQVLVVRTADRPEAAGLHNLLALLHEETEAPRPGASAVVAQLSSALFALLIRAWLEQDVPAAGLFAVLAQRRLHAALHGMLAAPHQAWSLKEMAAACHMSRATFARLFKQAAGATPAEVLTRIRMAQAARLLTQGRQSAGDVGAAVGYQSEAAFNRVFKRHHGVGPGAYRRRVRAPD